MIVKLQCSSYTPQIRSNGSPEATVKILGKSVNSEEGLNVLEVYMKKIDHFFFVKNYSNYIFELRWRCSS